MTRRLMSNKTAKISKEAIADLMRYCPRICLGEMAKSTKRKLKIAGVPAKMLKEHLPNERLERYCDVGLLGLTGLSRVSS
jgi:hypothetical protein